MCAQNLRHCVNSSRYGTAWVPDDLRIPHATVVAVDIGKWIQWVATIIFHNQRRETTRRETSSKRLRKISPYVTGVLNTHVYMLNFADHACPYHPKSSESPRYGTRWRWSLARRRASGSRRGGPRILWVTLTHSLDFQCFTCSGARRSCDNSWLVSRVPVFVHKRAKMASASGPK